jgi:L-amino acid N-acyltransferase YncA
VARWEPLGLLAFMRQEPVDARRLGLASYARRVRPTIREATGEDWPRIFPFYAAIVADGRTYTYPENQSIDEARSWWMEQAPGRTVVACAGDTIVGSAKMGPNRPGRGAHVATASFMVDPGHQGHGVGRMLAEHVVDWARASGYRAMQFNAVVEANTSAVRLWQSLGFEIVGTVPEAFDHREHGLVGLHVMFLPLVR